MKIAIATHKGGTAKTVTAMALSAALARAGKRCLLVDLDPQGHSTMGIGFELGDGEHTIRELLADPGLPVNQVILETKVNGLQIIGSNIRLSRVAESLYGRPKREEILLKALRPVQKDYDFVVMDCPPSLGVLTHMGIAAADFVIIPCLMEARAPDALVDLLELIYIIKGDKFDNWGILLTKVDSRKTITIEAVLAALASWKDKIFRTQIPQNESLNQAQMARTHIYDFDPKGKGAQAYLAFTEEILNYGKQTKPDFRRRSQRAPQAEPGTAP